MTGHYYRDMHLSSYFRMEKLLQKYENQVPLGRTAIDVGSFRVGQQSTYRPILAKYCEKYIGLDIVSGPNVDIVVPPHTGWLGAINGNQADLVVSGQCAEHVEHVWEWIVQVCDIAKPGSLLVLIAPWRCRLHQHPIDCWRILPDGMKVLFGLIPVKILETDYDPKSQDCWGVARKND